MRDEPQKPRQRAYLRVDEWYDTTLRDDDVAEELVQPKGNVRHRRETSEGRYSLLVIPDGELQVTRHNTLLLVVARRVARKLEDLSSKVLEYRREVD